MEPIVSIVVPVYNGEKYIDNCMDKILNQTYQSIEVILVNDGSKDNSQAICDEYAALDNRVKVCHKPNGGLSSARNMGIENATGEYIVFIDVDDEIELDTIYDNVSLAIENNADVVMFGFWYYEVDTGNIKPNILRSSFSGTDKEFFYNFLNHTIYHEVFNAPWNKLIRRSVLIDNNLRFDRRYPIYEDIIFAPQLLSVAKRITVNEGLYYVYYVRSSGSLITKFFENYFESVTQFHQNAMAYASKYKNNSKQIKKFDAMYVKYVYTHLKQISCKKDLKRKKKYELIKKIVNNKEYQAAIKNVQLKGRKRMMKYLIIHKRYRTICLFYQIFNNIQSERML